MSFFRAKVLGADALIEIVQSVRRSFRQLIPLGICDARGMRRQMLLDHIGKHGGTIEELVAAFGSGQEILGISVHG
jgi:phosphomevalonate kinase